MRTKTGFSFFSKMTYSKKKPSPSKPKKGFDSSEIDLTIDNAAEIIEKWNTEYVSTTKFYSLFCESKKEAKNFIKGVKDLQKSMDSLIKENPNSENLLRAQKLMQVAMKRLQSEFYQILSMNRAHLDPETVSTYGEERHESRLAGDSIVEVEEVSKNSTKELKSIAECMIAAGYAKECASTYKSFRKSIVDEGIFRLGVEKVSSSKVKKMPSEVVEKKMRTWIDAVNVSMKTLFNGEKTLCDEVFEGSVSLRESCFRDISKEGALLLLGFPETVAVRDKKNPNPKKIFTLLDMYGTITDNLPVIESIFSFQSVSSVRSQALSSLNRLSESILSHLVDFESEIRKDSSKTVVPGGGVHPMTISAMDHLSRLAEYSIPLTNIIVKGSSSSAKTLLPKSYFNVSESDHGSEVRVRFAWMVLVLLCKIDGKAEMYKDFSVQYLFLANNLQHVASRARSTSLKHILGDEWIVRHFEKVGQFARSYQRIAWEPLASMCPPKTVQEMSPEEAKMQLETFNECFESTCESQSTCVVADPKLLEEMRASIVGKLLPAYRDFYNAHANSVAGTEGGWNVRYTPDDVAKYLSSELFSGKGVLQKSCAFRTSFGLVSTARNASRRKKRSLSCRRF
ncbi:hypothetical protein Bca101_054542 [Brassica carinata]